MKCVFDSETEKFKTLGGIEECMLYCNVSHQKKGNCQTINLSNIFYLSPELQCGWPVRLFHLLRRKGWLQLLSICRPRWVSILTYFNSIVLFTESIKNNWFSLSVVSKVWKYISVFFNATHQPYGNLIIGKFALSQRAI